MKNACIKSVISISSTSTCVYVHLNKLYPNVHSRLKMKENLFIYWLAFLLFHKHTHIWHFTDFKNYEKNQSKIRVHCHKMFRRWKKHIHFQFGFLVMFSFFLRKFHLFFLLFWFCIENDNTMNTHYENEISHNGCKWNIFIEWCVYQSVDAYHDRVLGIWLLSSIWDCVVRMRSMCTMRAYHVHVVDRKTTLNYTTYRFVVLLCFYTCCCCC